MKSLAIWVLSLVSILLPACGQQLVEFRNPGTGNSDAGVTDGSTDAGEDAELILDADVTVAGSPVGDSGQ